LINKKRILIFDRHDSQQHPGGDTVQLKAMEKYLIENNFDVTITSDSTSDVGSFDIIFILNLQRPYDAYFQAKLAVENNKPYIFFPIYWDLDNLHMDEVFSMKYLAKRVFPKRVRVMLKSYYLNIKDKRRTVNRSTISIHSMMLFILRHASVICPNSFAELEHLVSKFPNEDIKRKARVIYNGLDINKLDKLPNLSMQNRTLPNEYICCVGAIGPRKNQLNLVKAANLVGVNLVIIGKAATDAEAYYNHVRKIAKDHIYFIDHCEQETAFEIMKQSKGHIQPSYIETPGLASLEAISLGVPIVVSKVGPVEEYFGNRVIYVNPFDYKSIANGIFLMSSMEMRNQSDYFREKYNWDNVLRNLLLLLRSYES